MVVLLVLLVKMSLVVFGSLVVIVVVLMTLGKQRACKHSQQQGCGKQFFHAIDPIMYPASG